MKAFIYMSFCLALFCSVASGQCTDGGLKVQSSACEAPQNLTVFSTNCTEVKLGWAGSKSQAYIVKATLWDSINGTTTLHERQVNTDKAGNGEATINVSEGVQLHWTVQAICSGETYKMYSKEVAGSDAIAPFCPASAGTTPATKLVAYPNPANNYLMIVYQPSTDGSTTFDVYNIEGKKMMSQTQSAVAGRKNSYRLNVMSLHPGTYLLKVSSVKDGIDEVKFVKTQR